MDAIAALTARGRERLARLNWPTLELGSPGALARALGYSDFLNRIFMRWDRETVGALVRGAASAPTRASLATALAATPALAAGTERALALIALRELTGLAPIRESLLATSVVAESVLARALAQEPECPAGFVIFGLGKLGGRDLNFYSDLDLVFGQAVSPDGRGDEEPGRRAQRLLARLEGGFRVDLRLRPFGQSGPLVMGLGAMEAYFQHHGREWERYAWLKARAVAGARGAGREFLRRLRPFIYRRYLDYHAIDALREMKRQIAEEAGVSTDDIKRGPGGIREIEFVVQAFQLVRGGRNAALAGPRLAAALRAAQRLELLPNAEAEALAAAYYFLRRLENRLQMEQLNPVHRLPEDGERRERLAASLGYREWTGLARELARHRAQVQRIFAGIFGLPPAGSARTPAADLWLNLREPAARELVAGLGFLRPEETQTALEAFKGSRAVRLMNARGRRALDRVMPELLEATAGLPDPDRALERLLNLLGALVRRSVYLALLAERPAARHRLVELVGRSEWIARRLAATPAALDELLDPRLVAATGRLRIRRDMAVVGESEDPDLAAERLREINETQRLKLAAGVLDESLAPLALERALTLLAEISLRACLTLAARRMCARHGPLLADLLILGYGKLGGGELGFASDLDLVFVYETKANASADGLAAETYLARLAQRTISLLSLPVATGSLYTVDTRLRPEGAAGLLLTSFAAWRRYQRESAWPWERQALLRARPAAGSGALARRFHGERLRLLARPLDSRNLAQEIISMRERVAGAGPRRGENDAALLDGEFLAAYWVLDAGARFPEILRSTRLGAQLTALARRAARPQAAALAAALAELRAGLNRKVLGVTDMDDARARARERIAELWRIEFGGAPV